jgi:hypothetical protein
MHVSMERGMRIISAVKRGLSLSVYDVVRILRGRWCDMIVLNIHVPTENKM